MPELPFVSLYAGSGLVYSGGRKYDKETSKFPYVIPCHKYKIREGALSEEDNYGYKKK